MGAIKAISKMHWCIALVAFPLCWSGKVQSRLNVKFEELAIPTLRELCKYRFNLSGKRHTISEPLK